MDAEFETSRLSVRLGAIQANYKTFQRLAGPAAAGAVVKANAYGLGLGMVAAALVGSGCDSFFVARIEEGVALRSLAPKARIFVLDGANPDCVPALITHQLTPVLNSLAQIAGWGRRGPGDAWLSRRSDPYRYRHEPAWPSGRRAGARSAEAKKRLRGLRIVLWLSHLACADDPDARMNRAQLDRFRTALAMLPPGPASLAASGGVMLGRDYAFDMVRPGIGLYGGNPQPPA